MITQIQAFYAFLAGLTQHLIYKESCEKAPRGFPRNASWIYLPKTGLDWPKLF